MSDLYNTDFHEWAETQAGLLGKRSANPEAVKTAVSDPLVFKPRSWHPTADHAS